MSVKIEEWCGPQEEGIIFFCPGCNDEHRVRTKPEAWKWNGSLCEPTIEPSIAVTSTAYGPDKLSFDEFNKRGGRFDGEDVETHKAFCHSFVKKGRIEFLSDCTHALAGQTVDLPDWVVNE